jgi:hypothetical protein
MRDRFDCVDQCSNEKRRGGDGFATGASGGGYAKTMCSRSYVSYQQTSIKFLSTLRMLGISLLRRERGACTFGPPGDRQGTLKFGFVLP